MGQVWKHYNEAGLRQAARERGLGLLPASKCLRRYRWWVRNQWKVVGWFFFCWLALIWVLLLAVAVNLAWLGKTEEAKCVFLPILSLPVLVGWTWRRMRRRNGVSGTGAFPNRSLGTRGKGQSA